MDRVKPVRPFMYQRNPSPGFSTPTVGFGNEVGMNSISPYQNNRTVRYSSGNLDDNLGGNQPTSILSYGVMGNRNSWNLSDLCSGYNTNYAFLNSHEGINSSDRMSYGQIGAPTSPYPNTGLINYNNSIPFSNYNTAPWNRRMLNMENVQETAVTFNPTYDRNSNRIIYKQNTYISDDLLNLTTNVPTLYGSTDTSLKELLNSLNNTNLNHVLSILEDQGYREANLGSNRYRMLYNSCETATMDFTNVNLETLSSAVQIFLNTCSSMANNNELAANPSPKYLYDVKSYKRIEEITGQKVMNVNALNMQTGSVEMIPNPDLYLYHQNVPPPPFFTQETQAENNQLLPLTSGAIVDDYAQDEEIMHHPSPRSLCPSLPYKGVETLPGQSCPYGHVGDRRNTSNIGQSGLPEPTNKISNSSFIFSEGNKVFYYVDCLCTEHAILPPSARSIELRDFCTTSLSSNDVEHFVRMYGFNPLENISLMFPIARIPSEKFIFRPDPALQELTYVQLYLTFTNLVCYSRDTYILTLKELARNNNYIKPQSGTRQDKYILSLLYEMGLRCKFQVNSSMDIISALLQHFIEENVGQPNGFSTKEISSIPKTELSTITKVNNKTVVCAICVDEIYVGYLVMELACKHMFHTHCLEQWLLLQRSCPTCRSEIYLDKSPSSYTSQFTRINTTRGVHLHSLFNTFTQNSAYSGRLNEHIAESTFLFKFSNFLPATVFPFGSEQTVPWTSSFTLFPSLQQTTFGDRGRRQERTYANVSKIVVQKTSVQTPGQNKRSPKIQGSQSNGNIESQRSFRVPSTSAMHNASSGPTTRFNQLQGKSTTSPNQLPAVFQGSYSQQNRHNRLGQKSPTPTTIREESHEQPTLQQTTVVDYSDSENDESAIETSQLAQPAVTSISKKARRRRAKRIQKELAQK